MALQHVYITGHCGQAVEVSSIVDDNVPHIQSRIDMSANLFGLTTIAIYPV